MEKVPKPKGGSLGERRQEKENKGKRTEVEATADGYLLYPEEKIEITVERALELAKEAIEKYSDPEALFADFARREKANVHRQDYKPLTDDRLREEIEEDMKTQRSFAGFQTTENLLKMFALHEKNPKYYYGIMLLASAEELQKRLEPHTEGGGE